MRLGLAEKAGEGGERLGLKIRGQKMDIGSRRKVTKNETA